VCTGCWSRRRYADNPVHRPRGPGSPRGIGLSEDQVEDLTDFLESGLYDPAFVHFDPDSSTRMFQLSPPDFLYSIYRPDLAALGAVDGGR
jgi:hypothetical protein